MKKALIEFICTLLICVSLVVISVLFKSSLVDFVPIMNEVLEWFVQNYVFVIAGVSTILVLVLLKNFLLKI